MSTGLQSVSPRVDAPAPPSTDAETSLGAKGDKPDAEFTFNDLIDIINPLQHLPVVSTIYRAITGDEISTHARAIGGGLYGGPLGMLAAGAIMAIEEAAGTNPSEQLAALFNSDSGDAPEQAGGVQVAAAPGTSPATAAAAAASPEAMALAAAPGGANTAAAPVPTAAEGPVMPFTARSGRRFFAPAERRRSADDAAWPRSRRRPDLAGVPCGALASPEGSRSAQRASDGVHGRECPGKRRKPATQPDPGRVAGSVHRRRTKPRRQIRRPRQPSGHGAARRRDGRVVRRPHAGELAEIR